MLPENGRSSGALGSSTPKPLRRRIVIVTSGWQGFLTRRQQLWNSSPEMSGEVRECVNARTDLSRSYTLQARETDSGIVLDLKERGGVREVRVHLPDVP